jgi:hypothetical protein
MRSDKRISLDFEISKNILHSDSLRILNEDWLLQFKFDLGSSYSDEFVCDCFQAAVIWPRIANFLTNDSTRDKLNHIRVHLNVFVSLSLVFRLLLMKRISTSLNL